MLRTRAVTAREDIRTLAAAAGDRLAAAGPARRANKRAGGWSTQRIRALGVVTDLVTAAHILGRPARRRAPLLADNMQTWLAGFTVEANTPSGYHTNTRLYLLPPLGHLICCRP